MEALAVEMTVCQCIATAKRGVAQGFPRRSRVSIKIQPARLQNLFIKRLFYIHSGAIISFGDSPMVGFPLLKSGGDTMRVYEALSLMIAFGTLVAIIISVTK